MTIFPREIYKNLVIQVPDSSIGKVGKLKFEELEGSK